MNFNVLRRFTHISLHPIMPITAGCTLAMGIFYNYNFAGVWCLIIPLTILHFWCSYQKTSVITLLLLGTLVGAARTYHSSTHTMTLESHYVNTPIQLIATVLSRTDTGLPLNKTTLDINVHCSKVQTEKKWTSFKKQLRVYMQEEAPPLPGDQILISYSRISIPSNESMQNYLLRDQCDGTIFTKKLRWNLLHRPYISVQRMLYEHRHRIYQSAMQHLSAPGAMLYSSIFLGYRSPHRNNLEPLSNECRIWGITHYLSRSGLHLVIFASLWEHVFKLIPLHQALRTIFLILMGLLYFLLSWSSTPFNRAISTFFLRQLCTIIGIPTHTLYHLTVVFFAHLLANPIHLLFLDFQLTFAFTAILCWFSELQSAHRRAQKLINQVSYNKQS